MDSVGSADNTTHSQDNGFIVVIITIRSIIIVPLITIMILYYDRVVSYLPS